jgi:hypothetical protein
MTNKKFGIIIMDLSLFDFGPKPPCGYIKAKHIRPAYQPSTSIYSGLSAVHANYTAKTSKPFTRLYSGISVDLPYSSTHNTATAQAAYTPTAPRWRAYRQAQHLHRYQIQPPRWTLHSLTQPPYYNNVYKSAPPVMDTC